MAVCYDPLPLFWMQRNSWEMLYFLDSVVVKENEKKKSVQFNNILFIVRELWEWVLLLPQIATKDIKPGSVSKSVLIQGISRDIHQNSANGQIYLGSIQGLLESGIQHKALPQPRAIWMGTVLARRVFDCCSWALFHKKSYNKSRWTKMRNRRRVPGRIMYMKNSSDSNEKQRSCLPQYAPNDLCLDTFMHQRQMST